MGGGRAGPTLIFVAVGSAKNRLALRVAACMTASGMPWFATAGEMGGGRGTTGGLTVEEADVDAGGAYVGCGVAGGKVAGRVVSRRAV